MHDSFKSFISALVALLINNILQSQQQTKHNERPAGTQPIYSITHLAPDQSLARNHFPARLLLVQYPSTIHGSCGEASKPLAAVRVRQQHTLLTLPVGRSLWFASATIFFR